MKLEIILQAQHTVRITTKPPWQTYSEATKCKNVWQHA